MKTPAAFPLTTASVLGWAGPKVKLLLIMPHGFYDAVIMSLIISWTKQISRLLTNTSSPLGTRITHTKRVVSVVCCDTDDRTVPSS